MDWQNNRVDTSVRLDQSSAPRTSGASIGARRNPSQFTNANPATLSQGQVVHGEITDLTNHDVTIALEDNTIIHAKITDSSQLSIGQTAAFRVSEVSSRQIVLEQVSTTSTDAASQTIMKALDEAGLPKNEKNMEVVRELLSNQLSISRSSISNILQQSYANPGVSIATLVTMNRQQIPITKNNANMLEQYRNGTQTMMNDIESLSQELPALLDVLSENAPAGTVAGFGKALLSLIGQIPANGVKASEADCSSLSPQERAELAQVLDKLPPDSPFLMEGGLTKESILDGTANLGMAREAYQSVMDMNTETVAEATAEVTAEAVAGATAETPEKSGLLHSLSGMWEQLRQGLSSEKTAQEPQNLELGERLNQAWQQAQLGNHELGLFLNQGERSELGQMMSHMNLSQDLLSQIQDGTATLQDVLTELQQAIAQPEHANAAKELFQSDVFQRLFKESVAASWTLTPQALGKKEEVDRLYPKMEQQVTGLKNLISQNLSGDDADHMAKQSQDMKDHIDFMKSLNEMFSYIQLPVKTNNGLIHSDLYVYTKKNNTAQTSRKVSALLKLDLEHLGELDIQVELEYNAVKATFQTTHDDTYRLLSKNLDVLEDSLNQVGYSLDGKVEKSSSMAKPLDELFSERAPVGSVKRYSFDIRA